MPTQGILFGDICAKYHGANPQSIEAYQSLQPAALNHMRKRVFDAVRAQGTAGATVDELETLLGMRHQSVSARVAELKAAGFLVLTNQKRRTRSGRFAGVLISG